MQLNRMQRSQLYRKTVQVRCRAGNQACMVSVSLMSTTCNSYFTLSAFWQQALNELLNQKNQFLGKVQLTRYAF